MATNSPELRPVEVNGIRYLVNPDGTAFLDRRGLPRVQHPSVLKKIRRAVRKQVLREDALRQAAQEIHTAIARRALEEEQAAREAEEAAREVDEAAREAAREAYEQLWYVRLRRRLARILATLRPRPSAPAAV